MQTVRRRRIPPPLVLAMVAGSILLPGAPTRAAAPEAATLEEFRQAPMSFFFGLRTRELIECGQAVLEGKADFTASEKKEAMTALAATYLASGKETPARAAVRGILATDPRADLSHPEELPPPLVTLFYSLRDSLALRSDEPGAPQILTLAVGDIESNSIVKGKYDLDAFARGLTHIMTTDLGQATPFRLVDRQRLAALRAEIDMSSNDQITDPKYAVKLGRLCGAQSYLFGSLMQTEKDRVRLDVRWVDTSTSEILLSEGFESKLGNSEDLFRLERKLLLDVLAPKMQAWLSEHGHGENILERARPYLDQREKAVPGKDGYAEYLTRTGQALLAEERGDFAAARTGWKEAEKLVPGDAYAANRARSLDAQLAMAAGKE